MNKFFLPFKGVFCRVQPIAFDGTLSFLELLNKLQYYVNQLYENINAVADGVYDALAGVKSYADNTFQIKNEFAVATRSQHGTNPTTISCNILFTTLIAYNQQNRMIIVKMTDDIDFAPANVHWFYFAGFEYDSHNVPITAWFIGYNGKLTCDSLNEWTYTPNA